MLFLLQSHGDAASSDRIISLALTNVLSTRHTFEVPCLNCHYRLPFSGRAPSPTPTAIRSCHNFLQCRRQPLTMSSTTAATPSSPAIPVIDLSLPTPQLTPLLHSVCSTSGFFYLINHSVPAALVSRIFDLSQRFFALPAFIKQRYLTNRHNRGYTPTDDEKLDEDSPGRSDTKESFYWSGHRLPDTAHPLWGPNVLVSDEDVAGFNQCMDEYMAAMSAVGLQLTELLYVALHGGHDDEGNWARKVGCFDDPTVVLRLVRYDERISSEKERQLACGAHTDWGMITLLATDEQPGLQIWTRGADSATDTGGGWLSVPPMPGAFIVNLGDLLMRWTNGRYRSTLHRVINTTGRPRYSIPVFYEPNADCLVECLASCVDEQHPLQFDAPVTAGRYLADRYAATQERFRHATSQQAETSSSAAQ